jgi:RNA polymerase sigma-70 factor (ECF subfamily)
MPDAPPTRPSLLVRLRDHRDDQAWGEFVELYAPLVYDYARRHGLQDADAADLTQNCLRQVAAHVGSLDYDPRRGTFRGWLFTIVRNMVRDFHSPSRRRSQGSGNPSVQRWLEFREAPESEDEARWEREYQLGLQAFCQTAVEGKSGAEVAQALGLTVAAVYLAKSRVMARLRAALREVPEEE